MTGPRIEAAVSEWIRQINSLSIEKTGVPAKWTDPEILSNIRNAMTSAIAAADAAAWRPIESAPKDGTEIIAYGTQKADALSPIEPYLGVVWWEYELWQDGSIACRPVLTHWQPLPAPPASITELGGVDG